MLDVLVVVALVARPVSRPKIQGTDMKLRWLLQAASRTGRAQADSEAPHHAYTQTSKQKAAKNRAYAHWYLFSEGIKSKETEAERPTVDSDRAFEVCWLAVPDTLRRQLSHCGGSCGLALHFGHLVQVQCSEHPIP